MKVSQQLKTITISEILLFVELKLISYLFYSYHFYDKFSQFIKFFQKKKCIKNYNVKLYISYIFCNILTVFTIF